MGPIASMTGYGRAEARGSRLAVVVEARSLNHRFLEISVKLPRGLSAHEPEIRQLAQARLARGRLDAGVVLRRVAGSSNAVRTDHALGEEYVRAARALGDAVGVAGQLGLADLLRLPGVVTVEEAEDDDGETALLLKDAAQQALDELVRMRQTEGAALAADLTGHLEALEAWAEVAGALLPVAVRRVQDRLRARIHALLEEAPVDPAAWSRKRRCWRRGATWPRSWPGSCPTARQFRTLLGTGGPIGRQLDFLLQEMHREVNTIASKADDAEMVARVLEARTVVERLREQVQNVE